MLLPFAAIATIFCSCGLLSALWLLRLLLLLLLLLHFVTATTFFRGRGLLSSLRLRLLCNYCLLSIELCFGRVPLPGSRVPLVVVAHVTGSSADELMVTSSIHVIA